LAVLAKAQAGQAASLAKLARESRETCDQLVARMGIFRVAAHAKARELIDELADDPDVAGFVRRRQEELMRVFVRGHPAFELVYITDPRGRQVTSNISADDFRAAYGTDGFGSDWSERPWFKGAVGGGETFVSDVYRSAASGQFCFTVSRLIRGPDGTALGVIGADVRFEEVLNSSL
jgi:hypothetical protein